MAQSREHVDEAFAGDIIGIHDTSGLYKIGDTLTNHMKVFKFDKMPSFAPEHFIRVYAKMP